MNIIDREYNFFMYEVRENEDVMVSQSYGDYDIVVCYFFVNEKWPKVLTFNLG